MGCDDGFVDVMCFGCPGGGTRRRDSRPSSVSAWAGANTLPPDRPLHVPTLSAHQPGDFSSGYDYC